MNAPHCYVISTLPVLLMFRNCNFLDNFCTSRSVFIRPLSWPFLFVSKSVVRDVQLSCPQKVQHFDISDTKDRLLFGKAAQIPNGRGAVECTFAQKLTTQLMHVKRNNEARACKYFRSGKE